MAKSITCLGDEIDTQDSSGNYTISYSGSGSTTTVDLSSALSSLTTGPNLTCISTISLPTTCYTTSGTINSGSSYAYSNNCYTWANPINNTTVSINTDGIKMDAGTDIKIGDKSLKEFMLKMEERMAILVPDPKKLEKFAALKKAYENYKLLEKLCQEEDKEE